MDESSTTRFAVLLGVMALLLVLVPPLAEAGYGFMLVSVAFPALLFVSAYAVGGWKSVVGRALLLLAGLAIVGDVFAHLAPPTVLVVLIRSIQAGFLLLVAGLLLAHIFGEHHVTRDTILGGICVYMLFGLVFHSIFALLEFLVPGSFEGADVAAHEVGHGDMPLARHPELLYYSFVTLTTLGYGDITPTWSLPQSLSAAEALLGQLYLTILVAILVGMHLASRSSPR